MSMILDKYSSKRKKVCQKKTQILLQTLKSLKFLSCL